MAIQLLPTPPKYLDPYLGFDVFGNIMDTVDSPTYTATLYMLRSGLSEQADSEVSKVDENLLGKPSDTVILAKTGVTGTTIDNINLSTLSSTEKPNAVGVSFGITQPGAANFLDQIQMAKLYLGHPNTATPTVFLEIRFQGRAADIDNNEEGGEPVLVAGPFRYKLAITDFTVKIDDTGSHYEVETIALQSYAFRNVIYKLPKTFTTVGKTITDHVTDFETQLNNFHKEAANNGTPDEIVFVTTELIGAGADGTIGQDKINKDTLITGEDAEAEDVNRVLNETYAIADAVDHRQAIVDTPKTEGTESEPIFSEDRLMSKEGITIDNFFLTLLSMCPEFYDKITRKAKIDDPEDTEVNTDQGFVTWFKIKSKVEQLKFDETRNDYAHRYTYTPILYKSARKDIAVSKEELALSIEDADKVIKQTYENGGIKKAYHYLFTGLNDQILNLDITYDNGIGLLLPPKGGAYGEFSTVTGNKLTGQTGGNEDTSLKGVVDDLIDNNKKSLEKSLFGGLLSDVKSAIEGVTDGIDKLNDFADQISDLTGMGLDVVKDIIDNPTELGISALTDALGSAELSQVTGNANINGAVPPIDSGVPPDYDPQTSAYVYGADLVQASETPMDAADLARLGYYTIEDTGEGLEVKSEVQRTQSQENEADSGTYKVGSVRNTLFGVLATQHQNDAVFLNVLDMTVRGDPWFLGSHDVQKSQDDAGNFYGDDNCFWLTIRTPVTYDPDFTDEDLNSGYWQYNGVSKTFSGLYRLISVDNNFSGGIYTCDIQATRIVGAEKVPAAPPPPTPSSPPPPGNP